MKTFTTFVKSSRISASRLNPTDSVCQVMALLPFVDTHPIWLMALLVACLAVSACGRKGALKAPEPAQTDVVEDDQQ